MEKKPYEVLQAFRVGADQRWLKPDPDGKPVELLPCEAQYPLSRGWLKPVEQKQAAKPAAKTEG